MAALLYGASAGWTQTQVAGSELRHEVSEDADTSLSAQSFSSSFAPETALSGTDTTGEGAAGARLEPEERKPAALKLPDSNERYYYKHRTELSLETGALWINTPFVFDVFVGGDYKHNPLHYTLVPIFPAVRWTPGRVSGPGPLRGNTELTASFSLTVIARGPETAYGAFDLGFRRNFIQRNWKVVPYFDGWLGMGFINAAGPHGNPLAQGQDFTFTVGMGTGLRYQFNDRYGASLAGNYMHVSNLYLSEPQYIDNGINVVGATVTVYQAVGTP